ncbi:MAG: gliding motility lipoprotein GldH [Paludibacteraceae bacterium]|nr:gliding motility lipoprotein GldH [Paludibacteraceae bacterium]
MKSKCLILGILGLVLMSCAQHTVYSEFYNMSAQQWHRDSVCAFRFHIDDTAAIYQLRMHLNHRETYRYQNIWLFVDDPSRVEMPHDTLLFYLANDRGEWLGRGKNGLIEMSMLYQEQRLFPDTGYYTIRIMHGMRDTILPGIDNLGFEILKYGKK